MGESPGDGGDGLAVVRRRGVVHGELARAERDRRRALASAADGPAAADWLPVVLIIGQAVQPGPKLMLPVPLELVDQFGVPVNVHARTIDVAVLCRPCSDLPCRPVLYVWPVVAGQVGSGRSAG